MFKCGKCGKGSVHGEKPTKVVTETRERVYPEQGYWDPLFGRDVVTDPGGEGWEIVKEVDMHAACAKEEVVF